MTISLFDIAKRQLESVFNDRNRCGVVVLLHSPRINRSDLSSWIIDAFADEPDPRHPFTALYVTNQTQHMGRVVAKVKRARKARTGFYPDQLVIDHTGTRLPALPAFTYMVDVALERLAPKIGADTLDLLVLDECHPFSLEPFRGFVNRVEPALTVVVTKHFAPQGPWQDFGKPIDLRAERHPSTRQKSRA